MSKKLLSRASLVCGAVCMLCACTLVGCRRDKSAEPVKPTPNKSHMTDAKLKQRLRAQISERDVLLQAQHVIIEKMEAVVKRYDGDMKKAGADPEMLSLIRRARDIETNLSSNRTHSAEMIRATALKGSQAASAPANKNALKKEVK